MSSPVPTPVAAAIGLVPTLFGGVRRLPGKAVRLPVYAVGHVLTTVGSARREYDALAERGEQLINKLRGTSFDEVEDAVEDSLQGTPFAKPYDVVEDALEEAGEAVTQLVRSGRGRAGKTADTAGRGKAKAADALADGATKAGRTAGQAAETVAQGAAEASRTVGQTAETVAQGAASASRSAGQVAETLADSAEAAADAVQPDETPAAGPLPVETAVLAGLDLPSDSALADLDAAQDAPVADSGVADAEAPKGVPTPKATEPDSTRIDTAASGEVVEVVERVSASVGGPVLEHDELPLPDYDHMTLGSLRGRMRSLDLPQLVQIRDYEKAHADRLPIVTMLDNRIAKLANDPTAPLSGSSPADAASAPAKGKRAKGGSKVKPATADAGASDPNYAFGGLGASRRGGGGGA